MFEENSYHSDSNQEDFEYPIEGDEKEEQKYDPKKSIFFIEGKNGHIISEIDAASK